jgi:Family of unknown function (DUF5320)
MPRGDRTGPMGMGPLTGRGAGFCAGSRGPLFGRFFRGGYGRGAAFGGGGRGWRHKFYETGLPGWMRFGRGGPAFMEEPSPDTEKRLLEEEAGALKNQLEIVRKLLDALKGEEGEEDKKK